MPLLKPIPMLRRPLAYYVYKSKRHLHSSNWTILTDIKIINNFLHVNASDG